MIVRSPGMTTTTATTLAGKTKKNKPRRHEADGAFYLGGNMARSKTRLYRIWHNMKQRCGNPNNTVYAYYGGKGISVCDEWKNSFHTFAEWAYANGYTDEMTIDRIDSDVNYCPSNCRWVSRKDQANNTSSNRIIEYNGRSQTTAQWAEELGINQKTLWARLEKWPIERVFKEKTHSEFGRKTLTYNDETHSIWEWARITGIKPSTISARINRNNWPVEKALTTPAGRRC